MLDVDFVVDQSLALDLEDEARHGQLTDTLAGGAAIVLPAFEAWDQSDRGKKIALTAVMEGKVRNCFQRRGFNAVFVAVVLHANGNRTASHSLAHR